MKRVGVCILTTNGVVLLGENIYIGGATIAFDVPNITAQTMTELYELRATISHRSNHWRVQINKRQTKKVEFFDIED